MRGEKPVNACYGNDVESLSKKVAEDILHLFILHFGNLRNCISMSECAEEFNASYLISFSSKVLFL